MNYYMNIRKARIEDAKSIALLCQNTIKYVNSRDYTAIQIKVWLGKNTTKLARNKLQSKDNPHFVILDDNKIVGVVSARPNKRKITGLYINRKYMGQKIGRKLLQKMEMFLYSEGIIDIELQSTITAFNFYKHQGYKKIKKDNQIISGVSIPIILMKKNLEEK